MSDEATTPSTTDTPTVTVQATPPAETFGLEYVQQLRQEAAKYRNEKKTAVDDAVAKLSQEWEGKIAAKDAELAEVKSSYSSKELETAKLRIAMRTLDQDTASRAEKLAELLKGESEDDITASAKSAYELFGGFKSGPVAATDPTQGHGGDVTPLNGDKLLDALKRVVGAP